MENKKLVDELRRIKAEGLESEKIERIKYLKAIIAEHEVEIFKLKNTIREKDKEIEECHMTMKREKAVVQEENKAVLELHREARELETEMRKKLKHQKDELQQENDRLEQVNKKSQQEKCKLEQEKGELQQSHDILLKEKDKLIGEFKNENKKLLRKLMQGSRYKMERDDFEELSREKDMLKETCQTLQAQLKEYEDVFGPWERISKRMDKD